jgi:hypothetical protein
MSWRHRSNGFRGRPRLAEICSKYVLGKDGGFVVKSPSSHISSLYPTTLVPLVPEMRVLISNLGVDWQPEILGGEGGS